MEYSFNNDYMELITETTNFTSPVYKEAAEDVEKNTNKGMAYFKNFISSIENLAAKPQVKDERITASKGNIKNFKGYSDIKTAISFINKNLSGVAEAKDCVTVFDALDNWSSTYSEGYSKNIRLIQLEYENAVFMLATSLSEILATNMDVAANGTEIRITKKKASANGVIQKTMKDLAAQLGNRDHKEYLEGLIKGVGSVVTESVYTEGKVENVEATVSMIKSLFDNGLALFKTGSAMFKKFKKTLFGIVPLIRSIMYIRYKKKADTIIALEEQIIFIERNIEQLETMESKDPKKKELIIKRQKAVAERFRKKSAKLRAQLVETEKDATQEAAKENPDLKNADGGLVLESALFTESKKLTPKIKKKVIASKGISKSEIEQTRLDKIMDKFSGVRAVAKVPADKDTEAKAKKAFKIFFENTKVKSVRLIPGNALKEDDDISKRKDTKIGGKPYWPVGKEWPTVTLNGKKINMICYAQINLDKIPKLPGYPSSGLLQFFIADEEMWGGSEDCKVILHTDTKEDCITDYPITTLTNDDKYASIDSVYFPTAKEEMQPMTCADDEFGPEVCKAINDVFGTSYKNWLDIPDSISKYFFKEAWDSGCYGCRFGGHPYFTQSDARTNKYSELLLQLDSEAGMMWGDCGVANFFISKGDLSNNKFDDVMFTWDCL